MKPVLLDTDTLSLFLRNDLQVVAHVQQYLQHFDTLNISIITKYEILSGLYHKDASKQLMRFEQLLVLLNVIPLNDYAVEIAAKKYAETRKLGTPIDDIDLLIAAIALANNLAIVTHNTKHFSKISELTIFDWKS